MNDKRGGSGEGLVVVFENVMEQAASGTIPHLTENCCNNQISKRLVCSNKHTKDTAEMRRHSKLPQYIVFTYKEV